MNDRSFIAKFWGSAYSVVAQGKARIGTGPKDRIRVCAFKFSGLFSGSFSGLVQGEIPMNSHVNSLASVSVQ
jgi:hypothetical protein